MRDDPYALMCGFCCIMPAFLVSMGWIAHTVYARYKLHFQLPIVATTRTRPGVKMTPEQERAAIRAIVTRNKPKPEDTIGYGP